MDEFMKIVSEKFVPNAVKELVLHNDGEMPVIFYPALREEKDLLETMHKDLPGKDRQEIQCQVDKFLDETYKIPQNDFEQDDEGNTPFMLALSNRSETKARELLKYSDVNITNNENETEIHLAVKWSTIPVDLLQLIIKKTKDIDASSNSGTPLALAYEYKSTTAIEMLKKSKKNYRMSLYYSGKTERRPEKMKFDKRTILGMGSYSTVFPGSLNGREVAVKRIQLPRVEIMQREEEMLRQLKHPNVIELLAIEEDDDFRFYVFELAAGTLDDFCQGYYKGSMPSDGEALKQMAEGLQYLHSKNFVHRDIKPSNIFISKNEPVRLMIANFGFCMATSDSGTYSTGSGDKGTEEWMAPETLDYSDDDSDDDGEQPVKTFGLPSDTWALGCLFFYFLTRGIHPFGKTWTKIRYNIIVKQRPTELEKTLQSSNNKNMVGVYKMIRKMIEKEPEKRMSIECVLVELDKMFPKRNQVPDFKITSEMSTTPSEPMENDLTTGKRQGNEGSSQQTENDNAADNVEGGNADKTEKKDEETPGPSNRGRDDQDKTGGGNGKQKDDCCMFCKGKIAKLEGDCKEHNKSKGKTAEKMGHVNQSLIRTNMDSKKTRTRSISTLFQLVKCFGEAKDEIWTDEDTHRGCERVIKYLRDTNSEDNFYTWYRNKAIDRLKKKAQDCENQNQKQKFEDNAADLEDKTSTDFMDQRRQFRGQHVNEKQYKVVAIYKDNNFTNFIPGPIENAKWKEFMKSNDPILLLALYESIKDKEDLLHFPPPGILTMDVPVKISSGKSLQATPLSKDTKASQSPKYTNSKNSPEVLTVFIELGEIKSSPSGIKDAKLQLRRSLLCFKWLHQVIEQVDASYGLIGNIYIEGNLSEAQKKKESDKKVKTEFIGEGITFKTRYVEYK